MYGVDIVRQADRMPSATWPFAAWDSTRRGSVHPDGPRGRPRRSMARGIACCILAATRRPGAKRARMSLTWDDARRGLQNLDGAPWAECAERAAAVAGMGRHAEWLAAPRMVHRESDDERAAAVPGVGGAR